MHNNNISWWLLLVLLPIVGVGTAAMGWKLPGAAFFVTGLLLCLSQMLFSAVSVVLALVKEDFSRARTPALTLVASIILMLLHSLMMWWGLQ